MIRVKTLLAVSLLAVAAGCADMNKQQMGTGVGAVIGGVAGSQVAKSNRVAGAVAGAAIGGLIGNRVGKYLNDQDKKRTADASTRTAQTGRPQQFRTNSGATVTTAPVPAATASSAASVKPPPPSSPAPAQIAAAQPECKTIRQTIVLSNGTREEEDVTMCNGPDGWQPA